MKKSENNIATTTGGKGGIGKFRAKLFLEKCASTVRSYKAKKQSEVANPQERNSIPFKIAELALFLASDDNQYVTGTTPLIDVGMSAAQ